MNRGTWLREKLWLKSCPCQDRWPWGYVKTEGVSFLNLHKDASYWVVLLGCDRRQSHQKSRAPVAEEAESVRAQNG